ncbi:hypothetical protein MYSTI_02066 [Myxococcus stipitatus DSM 14675]|uniref:HEAT repeat domain-containing protein n=1 Tax=Myxococcus stipitatus (strain DSM 14675 / JCM 12634 / Mx s8) TaxID=1278073 RepID=L7U6B6_MYXSD|nr:hypothetical protein [Myxococcus stipitatus]AGC43395.1 hypothetical protein MYSTI_02066 [Myxococcus stipitatus DSM 14675]
MRRLSYLVSLVLLGGCANQRAETRPESPPSEKPSKPAMVYRFEGIELFGTRKYTREELLAPYLAALPPSGTLLDMEKDGDAFIQALAKGKEQLQARHGFALIRNSVTAYAQGMTMRVTVDVVDLGDEWRLEYAPAPTGSVPEPEGLLTAWSTYLTRMWRLVNSGVISTEDTEPCRAFHCFYGPGHPELMPLEAPLLSGVPGHFETLVRMAHTDADATKREKAAYLLAYGPSRDEVARALVPLMNDPNEAPRNAAMRVLWKLQEKADTPLVPLEKVLRGLQGPLISDRNKAAGLLAVLVAKDTSRRGDILQEAGQVLLEMATAKQVIERKPALDVLRTLSGKDFGEDLARWRTWVQETLAAQPSRAPSPNHR